MKIIYVLLIMHCEVSPNVSCIPGNYQEQTMRLRRSETRLRELLLRLDSHIDAL